MPQPTRQPHGEQPGANPTFGKQTHDSGVRVVGPAVADLERCFRTRWNDTSRTLGMEPVELPLPMISTTLAAPTTARPHSVQVLLTYGITSELRGYSWSPVGGFTCWASFNNAVRTATDYIYIEDQYFLAFGSPPFCLAPTPGFARDTDPLWQLGQALLRGVSVVIVTSSSAEDPVHDSIKFQRGPGHPVTGCLGDDRRRGVRSGCGGRGGGGGGVRWSGAGCR